MASASLERIYRLTADASQAVREMQKLNTTVSGLDSKFSALGAGMKAFGVALAAGLSVDKIVSSVQSAIDSMDEMGKASQKVGIALDTLQNLKYMSDLSGVSFETLQLSIGKMSQAMSGFEGAGKKAADAMQALGVNMKGDTSEALAKIADQFQKMPDGAQKTALAMELFGKSGRDMIPFLNQGGDAIKAMADEADRLGFKFNEVASQQAERFNDAMTKIGLITRGLVNQFTSALLPALVAIAENFVEGYQKGELFSQLGSMVGEAFVAIARRVMVAVGAIKAFGTLMSSVGLAAETLVSGNVSGAWNVLQQAFGEAQKQIEGARVEGARLVETYKGIASQTTAASSGVAKLNNQLRLGGGGRGGRDNKEAERAAKAAEAARVAAQLAAAMEKIVGDEARADLNDWAQRLRFSLEEIDFKRAAEEAKEFEEQIKAMSDRVDASTLSLREQARALIEAHDPFARYEAETKRLEELKPHLPIQLYAKLVKELGENAHTWFAPIKREMSFLESAGKIMDDNFNSFFNNLQNGVAGAKEAFERMAQSMLVQLARLAASKLFERFFGEGTSWGLSTPPSLLGKRSTGTSLYTVPQSGVARAGADAGVFAAASQSSGVSVNVVNNAGAEIGVESRQNADGSTMIDILVERKVKGMIASGAMDRVMASTFGARRRGFA